MGANPDTVILGQTYKRIEEYNDSSGWGNWQLVERFYVRSDNMEKGYVMLLDSMQEYLAIDNSAQAGDTVQTVLIMGSWGPDPAYGISSVAVDSVFTLSNNGVTVTRQIVHPLWYPPMNSQLGEHIFWQAGIGGSYGPILYANAGDGFNEVNCLRVQGTYVYNDSPGGLPGIPCDCSLSPLGVEDRLALSYSVVSPNPSVGLFTLSGRKVPSSVSVYTYTGQLVWQGSGSNIDLTSQQPGIYTAVVISGCSSQAIRLMVVR